MVVTNKYLKAILGPMLDSWPGPRPVLAAAELALLPALAPPAASEMEERLPRVAPAAQEGEVD